MIKQLVSLLTGKVAVTVGTPEKTETRYEQPTNARENYLIEMLRQEIRKNPGATRIEVSDGKNGYSAECW